MPPGAAPRRAGPGLGRRQAATGTSFRARHSCIAGAVLQRAPNPPRRPRSPARHWAPPPFSPRLLRCTSPNPSSVRSGPASKLWLPPCTAFRLTTYPKPSAGANSPLLQLCSPGYSFATAPPFAAERASPRTDGFTATVEPRELLRSRAPCVKTCAQSTAIPRAAAAKQIVGRRRALAPKNRAVKGPRRRLQGAWGHGRPTTPVGK